MAHVISFQRLSTIVLLLMTILAGLSGPARRAEAQKPKLQLKVATLAPDGSTWMKIMNEMDAEVREATGNAVGFKFYPNAVQGDETVVLRKIRNGQLHGAGFSGAGLGELAPDIRVLELPFLFDDDAEVDLAHEVADSTFAAELDKKGYVLLGWAEVGPIYLFTNSPVQQASDMSKVKMWLWEGDPVAEEVFEVFNIPPIPLSIAHVMTSLQTGMIDGVYASPYACIALQWFSRVKYYTDVPMTHATGALVVSNKAFKRIPTQHQDTVREIARKHLDRLVEATRRENTEALAELQRQGVAPVTPDAAQLAGFRTESEKIWQDLAGKLYSPEILQRIIDALEAHRSDASSASAD